MVSPELEAGITAAFVAVDPAELIKYGSPLDEYSPETRDLCRRLDDGEALTADLVQAVLERWFKGSWRSEATAILALIDAPASPGGLGEPGAAAVTGVRFPAMRREVIACLESLADPEHQQRIWIERRYPHESYFDDLAQCVNVLDDIVPASRLEASIGTVLVSESEVRCVAAYHQALDLVFARHDRNDADAVFLADSGWPAVVDAAHLALTELLVNGRFDTSD